MAMDAIRSLSYSSAPSSLFQRQFLQHAMKMARVLPVMSSQSGPDLLPGICFHRDLLSGIAHCLKAHAIAFYNFLTISLKISPRCSKLSNWSQLAQLGESSTTSPLCEIRSASAIASSIVSKTMASW